MTNERDGWPRREVALRQLLSRAFVINHEKITSDCFRGYSFLAELAPDELVPAADQHQRERSLAQQLRPALKVVSA